MITLYEFIPNTYLLNTCPILASICHIGDHKPKDDNGDEQHIKVCGTYVHPQYKGTMKDIALLKLCKNVTKADNVGFVDLPSPGFELEEQASLRVAGWGLTRESGRISPILRVVNVSKIN